MNQQFDAIQIFLSGVVYCHSNCDSLLALYTWVSQVILVNKSLIRFGPINPLGLGPLNPLGWSPLNLLGWSSLNLLGWVRLTFRVGSD